MQRRIKHKTTIQAYTINHPFIHMHLELSNMICALAGIAQEIFGLLLAERCCQEG